MHGYAELPADLKITVLELAANAYEMPSGTATSLRPQGSASLSARLACH